MLKLVSAVTFLILSLQTPWPAYGLGHPDTKETEVVFPVEKETENVPTELLGNIEVALISVTMPTDIEFQVNPEADFDARNQPGGQIVCPDASALKVTNNSVVPVRLEIAEVADIRREDVLYSVNGDAGPKQSFRLVNRISEAQELGRAILVLGTADRHYAGDADFEQYAIYPGRKGIPVIEYLEAGGSEGLKVYGKVTADFYGEYQFTVRPTLKISAVRAH